LHKNVVDEITLVSAASGKPMKREADLIDVVLTVVLCHIQWHYPLKIRIKLTQIKISWISLLKVWIRLVDGSIHAIATLVFDKVAYKM
jgi:hypothetical protein